MTEQEIQRLINGKNETERIVSVEVHDNEAILFVQSDGGKVNRHHVSNKFWLLCNKQPDKTWVRMDGNLYYKWGKQFTTKKELLSYRENHRHLDLYGMWNDKEALLVKDGYTYFQGLKPQEVSILSFDIESTGIDHNDESKVVLISTTLRNVNGIQKKLFCYDEYENCGEMITAFCDYVQEIDPSIICGHNIYGYDLPYMRYCAERYGVTLNLGRDGSAIRTVKEQAKFRVDGSKDLHYDKVVIYGREIVDTMFLAYRHDATAKKYESYGLKPIISVEGLEKSDRVFYDASLIRKNYKIPEEWEKIKSYCVDDADDALALYDLMVPSYFYMTQAIPKSFSEILVSATGSQINSLMVRAYLQDRHSIPKTSPIEEFEGAISLGNPGIYRNVWKVDVASLYPSIMIEYNVYDKDKDPKQYFSIFVKSFTSRRLYHKKFAKTDPYHDAMQDAFKRLINSKYGFMGAPGLNFNSGKNAAFVTEKGREILTKALDWAKDLGFLIVNADTDSISICRADMTEITEEERLGLCSNLNSLFPKQISWEDDGYYPTFIVAKAKNYVLFDGKKIKYKGSALKASTKEPALKQFIKDVIGTILDKRENYADIYQEYSKEAVNIQDIHRWVKRVTISDKTMTNERANESKVRDAIAGTDYREGDRVYLYFKEDGTYGLAENFDGQYDRKRTLKKLYDTAQVFETILPVDDLFPNLTLRKNKSLLDNLI